MFFKLANITLLSLLLSMQCPLQGAYKQLIAPSDTHSEDTDALTDEATSTDRSTQESPIPQNPYPIVLSAEEQAAFDLLFFPTFDKKYRLKNSTQDILYKGLASYNERFNVLAIGLSLFTRKLEGFPPNASAYIQALGHFKFFLTALGEALPCITKQLLDKKTIENLKKTQKASVRELHLASRFVQIAKNLLSATKEKYLKQMLALSLDEIEEKIANIEMHQATSLPRGDEISLRP